MKAYTAAQVRSAEEPLLAAGVPLMARAAAALAEETAALLPERGSVLLLVGGGDNGGDALYAGAELARRGHRVGIVRTSSRVHEEALAAALAAGARPTSPAEAASAAAASDVVVDGILGTGTSADPSLRGTAREVVEAVGAVPGVRVIACDIPSGIHPDTGAVPDDAVLRADVTVAVGAAKTGLLREPAAGRVGRLVVADIGLGDELARFDAVELPG